ncbi:MAG TPA: acVLRF1 family peptidyl-tRNA hydrolase [Thermoanaerobaculia bacterium]|nr:acVLRF1 family peptidyl-tRNA hydrolase [Thermoanaerobaculia bacterium]
MKNSASGGARWVDVAPERFPGWVASFARRHGADSEDQSLTMAVTGDTVIFTAPDGAVAECHPPFPPVADNSKKRAAAEPGEAPQPGEPGDAAGPGSADGADSAKQASADEARRVAEAVAAHARRPRTVGVLLVRLGGYAAGVFTGYPPALADAKTGSRLVHGRSAAGGWSQHRFARRREKQASEALQAAASAAADVFGRRGGRGGQPSDTLDAIVLGGDKRAMAELRQDPRLAPYLAIATDRFLTVPDPKRAVLEATPRLFLAVRIRLTEPTP